MRECACGCKKQLTGRATKWYNDEHKNEFNTKARRAAAGKMSQLLSTAVSADATPVPIIKSFHNTVELEGEDLTAANSRASDQEASIFAYFVGNGGLHTPCEVAAAFPQWPITSVRRAITNMTKCGNLRKTSVRRQGVYGVANFCWCAA